MRILTDQEKAWQSRHPDYIVRLRAWEFQVYRLYDLGISKLAEACSFLVQLVNDKVKRANTAWLCLKYGKRVTALGSVVPDIEYYLIDGVVKIRKFMGNAGVWTTYQGKAVRGTRRIVPNLEHLTNNALEQVELAEDQTIAKRKKLFEREEMAHAKGSYGFNKEWFHAYDGRTSEQKFHWHKHFKEMGVSR